MHCRLPDAGWIAAWVIFIALIGYFVLAGVISLDLGRLQLHLVGENTKGIACGTEPNATFSPLMLIPYSEENVSLNSCVAECPSQVDSNLTICAATMVSTACPLPCEAPDPCEESYNVTGYVTQKVLHFCVPDPETAVGPELMQSQFATAALINFRYEVSPLHKSFETNHAFKWCDYSVLG
jgi:hypothetical protein